MAIDIELVAEAVPLLTGYRDRNRSGLLTVQVPPWLIMVDGAWNRSVLFRLNESKGRCSIN